MKSLYPLVNLQCTEIQSNCNIPFITPIGFSCIGEHDELAIFSLIKCQTIDHLCVYIVKTNSILRILIAREQLAKIYDKNSDLPKVNKEDMILIR